MSPWICANDSIAEVEAAERELMVVLPEPEATQGQRRRWTTRRGALGAGGAAVLLLVGAAAVSKHLAAPAAVSVSPRWDGVSTNLFEQVGLPELDGLPGIDEIIEKAKQLDMPPARMLQGRPFYGYAQNMKTLAAMRTECVIDTTQAASYVIQVVVDTYRAQMSCPQSTDVGCAATTIQVITSLLWVGSYVALASSSCAPDVWNGGLCASDWMGLMANLGEISSSSAALRDDCAFPFDVPEDVAAILHAWKPPAVSRGASPAGVAAPPAPTRLSDGPKPWYSNPSARKLSEAPRGNVSAILERIAQLQHKVGEYTAKERTLSKASPALKTGHLLVPPALQALADKAKARHDADVTRNMNHAMCANDVIQATAYLVRVVLQIRAAALACLDPKACAINILNIASSFAWIAQFAASAVNDCTNSFNQKAACTVDLTDIVAGLTNGAAAAMASTSDCAGLPTGSKEVSLEPTDAPQ